jgi:hypothetical protein
MTALVRERNIVVARESPLQAWRMPAKYLDG